MINGPRLLACLAAAAATSCSQSELTLRASPSPVAHGQKSVDFRLAEGRAQLMLGNAALALISFRKAARANPQSVEALVGLGLSYDNMGRFDLSRRYYETALALAPRDAQLLAAFADSMTLQGRHGDAAAIRAEVAALHAPPVTTPARPAGAPPPDLSTDTAFPAPLAVAELEPVEPRRDDEKEMKAGPRLERLSLGEVALVTSQGPMWKAKVVRRSDTSTTIRLPAARSAERSVRLRLLNAARVHRLAARTRSLLQRQGWQHVAIGDAPAVRSQSLILYPQGRRAEAEEVARRFDYPLRQAQTAVVTVLLGRDSLPFVVGASGD